MLQTLWSLYNYNPYFTNEKTEAQRDLATYPRTPSLYMMEPVYKSRRSDSRATHMNLFSRHWHVCAHRDPASLGDQIRHKPPGALSERTCAGPACDLTLVGPLDNGTTGAHQASWQRQCTSPSTSCQNNKHRWLPPHQRLNTEVQHPCLTTCGDTSVEKSQQSLLSPFPRGKIWGCFCSPARLLPPLVSPQSKTGLVWCESDWRTPQSYCDVYQYIVKQESKGSFSLKVNVFHLKNPIYDT